MSRSLSNRASPLGTKSAGGVGAVLWLGSGRGRGRVERVDVVSGNSRFVHVVVRRTSGRRVAGADTLGGVFVAAPTRCASGRMARMSSYDMSASVDDACHQPRGGRNA